LSLGATEERGAVIGEMLYRKYQQLGATNDSLSTNACNQE
jgi:hypothetical protein